MATIQIPSDFKEFLRLLNAAEVEYLLIGGYAVGYYGYPRLTADMDIWIAMTPENAARIVDVLKAFGFDLPELSPNLFLAKDRIVRMGAPPLRIEITTTIDGVEFDTCYKNRHDTVIDGLEVKLISLSDLKTNKKASGRYKDLDDLTHLK